MRQDDHIWERAKAILGEAWDLPAPDRAAFAEARCAGEPELRREVFSLMAAAQNSGAVLNEAADAWVGAAAEGADLPRHGRIGKFEVQRVIAQSPGAVVYLARQRRPDRDVALKVLRTAPLLGTDPRFWLEATAAARVEHPNVVRVYEAGVVELAPGHRAPYLAMEHVDGIPITHAARQQQLGAPRVIDLMKQVAEGVARIHLSGVIHRDLKPSNVLVDAGGRPRVLDFGVARLVSGTDQTWHTLQGTMVGTPGYMSPEGVESPDAVDVRSDVWALGALTFELLAGAPPFAEPGVSPLEMMRRVVHQEPPSLRRAVPRIPADLDAVVMKALARRPADRYTSAQAFADDLDRARRSLPVHARRPTWTYRASLFARRHTAALAVATVVAGALLSLSAAQVLSWRAAARERDRASRVIGMVRGMISSADTNFGRSDARMLDVLKGLEHELNRGAGPDPLTEADVRSLLGAMYFSAGEYPRSRSALEASIALRERAGAGASPEAEHDRAALAHTLRWLYAPDEATDLAERTRARTAARWGPRHPASIAARDAYAGCLLDAQRFDEAEREYRALLADSTAAHGPEARQTLTIRGNLVTALRERGRYQDAELGLRELLSLWSRHPGSLEILTTRINLASVLAEQGKLDEAIRMLADVEGDGAQALGRDHPTVVTARTNAIEFLRRSGREAEALDRSTRLVQELRSTFGLAHDLTLNQVVGQVASLIRAQHPADAVSLAREARDACTSAQPPASPWHARMDASLAAALSAAGRFDESLQIYASAIHRLQDQLGPDHRQTMVAQNNLAVAQIDAGRAADAVATLTPVLDRVRALGFEEMLAVVGRNLGRAQLAAGLVAEGIASLESAHALSTRRQELHNAAVCASLLADHYEQSRDAAAAESWRQRARDAAAP